MVGETAVVDLSCSVVRPSSIASAQTVTRSAYPWPSMWGADDRVVARSDAPTPIAAPGSGGHVDGLRSDCCFSRLVARFSLSVLAAGLAAGCCGFLSGIVRCLVSCRVVS